MHWRLGLDLGTNSLGWSVYSLSKNDEPEQLIDTGVRIFSDGREPKTGEPLAAARRTARGIRRNLRRRKQRRRALIRQLCGDRLFPETKEKAQALKMLDPYELRIAALDKKLKPHELGRALFHLGVRRGFKSNRKDSGEEAVPFSSDEKPETAGVSKKMTQGEKCLVLKAAIEESPYRTIGEFLYHQNIIQEKTNTLVGLRFAPGRFSWYPLRELYEAEFDAIRKKQEKYYPAVDWDGIKNTIFFQRPLKKQERGKCTFMPDHERTFKAMPSAIRFRILQDVYNLKMYDGLNQPVKISDDQRAKIISLLDSKKEVTFDAMRKTLKTQNRFNLEAVRTSLKGNDTGCRLRDETYFGTLWDSLLLTEQDAIVEAMIEAEDSSEVQLLGSYTLSDEQKKKISSFVPPKGTISMCKLFTQRAVATMEQDKIGYVEALAKMGFSHSEQKTEKYDLLPYYGKALSGAVIGGDPGKFGEDKPEQRYGKIANPTVHIALNQTRIVVNALIKQYGKPGQIAVELSRDLKASRDSKDEMRKRQTANAKRNVIINKNITDIIPSIRYPNRADRLKFRLWEELGAEGTTRRCLYCGKNISCSEVFTKNIEVEHILPYSRTLLDAESNLTVAHASCNAFKRERSPYEAFGSSPKGYDWNEICARVDSLADRAKRNRFTPDAMDVFEKDSGFITRQLTDNAYLSKTALRYLTCICDSVWAVSGGMTKLLRDKWEIDSILNRKIDDKVALALGIESAKIGEYKKNRYDHRHHALDAIIIGLIDRSMVQNIASMCARSQKYRIEVPPLPVSRYEIIEKLKNITVSFKPDHGAEGKLSKETLLGRIRQEMKIPVNELSEEDIPNIKDSRVREEFEELIAERKDFRKAVKELRNTYPEVQVFRHTFVNRTPLVSLKTEKNIEDIVAPLIREKLRCLLPPVRGKNLNTCLPLSVRKQV